MARKNVYTVSDISFRTKGDLKSHVQSILHSQPIDQPLEGDNLVFMIELLNLHPSATEKIGSGLKNIRVVESLKWKKRSFELERIDGSKTDFSYLKCIDLVSPEQEFRQACRALIADEIIEFRNTHFHTKSNSEGKILCPLTNDLITVNQSHVDHQAPNTFSKLINDFIRLRNLDVDSVEIGGHGDNQSVRTLADEELANNFKEFHRKHATLRVVSARSNLQLPKK